MNDWLGFAWLLLIVALAAWLLAAVIAPVLTKVENFDSSAPPVKARRLWLIALLPWLMPLIVVVAVCLLALGKQLGWVHDHCLHHGPGHPHLCFEHLPQLLLSYPQALLAGGLVSAMLVLSGRLILREQRQASRVNALNALAHGRKRFRILEQSQVAGFAAGLRTPKVFLSRGLLKRLDARQRRIVLAHEVAHLRNGDLRKNFLFECLLLLHTSFAAKTLRRQWRNAMETRADDCAASRFGATAVADALVAVVKASAKPAMPVSLTPVSIAGADPLQRVQRLLHPAASTSVKPFFECAYIAAGLLLGWVVINAHHGIETLLGILIGA